MVEVKILSVRLPKADSFALLCAARDAGLTVSDLVRAALAPIIRPSYDVTADVADTIAAQPIAKPTFTGHGRHDDFARAAAIGRRHEATATARQLISTMNHASAPDTSREALTFARAHGVLAD